MPAPETPTANRTSGIQQQADFFFLVVHRHQPLAQHGFQLFLTIHLRPFLGIKIREQFKLSCGGLIQDIQAALQGCGDGTGGAADQPLHQHHQEAYVRLLLPHGLIVAGSDVFRDSLVEFFLGLVTFPRDTD